jgi:hypothetical protein
LPSLAPANTWVYPTRHGTGRARPRFERRSIPHDATWCPQGQALLAKIKGRLRPRGAQHTTCHVVCNMQHAKWLETCNMRRVCGIQGKPCSMRQ